MKALVVTADHQLELKNISQPTPGPFEALVKILACGICSTTDSELIRGTQPNHSQYPCLLGHEAIGEIVEIGSGVKYFKPGDWVARPAGLLPGTTRDGLTSAWGGFSEYGLVTDHKAMVESGDNSLINDYTALRQNVLTDGPEIGLPASVLSIALAETLDWSEKLDMANKVVCVNGTGIAGLSLTLWAKLAGASKVITLGRRTERLELARELGADELVNISNSTGIDEVRELSGGGVDVFMEATGVANQMEVAIRSLKPAGIVGVYGVASDNMYHLDWRWFPADIRFMMHEPKEHLARERVVNLIKEGKIPVDKLMTHYWPMESFQQAFKAVQSGKVVKSMLIMP